VLNVASSLAYLTTILKNKRIYRLTVTLFKKCFILELNDYFLDHMTHTAFHVTFCLSYILVYFLHLRRSLDIS